MGSLFSLSANGNKSRHFFLVLLAASSFLFGLLTSPLSALLKCNSPRPTMDDPPRIAQTDWSSPDLTVFRTRCRDPISPNVVRDVVLQKIFDGVSPFEGFPPEYAKPWLSEKRIRGWGSYGAVFQRLITEVQPRIVLELGTYLGASAIHMANLSKSLLGRETLILCVDDFRGWPSFRDKFRFEQVNADVKLLYQFMQNVLVMNLTESVLPIPFSTTAAMAGLCQWGVYADLIEVDAAHDFHSAWADINRGHALLRPGGVMFGHDYYTKIDNRGVGRAVDLFAKIKGFRVEPDGQHWILRSR